MIAKRILSPKGGSGFRRLGAYVLNVKDQDKGESPANWTRLGAYILDEGNAGEKVAWARVSNCVAEDPGWAVKEIISTQSMNTRSERDKSYHLVVSFPGGERPTREQMEDIEDTLCAAIGLQLHQRVSAVHQNTDNWHLHVAISTVDPVTFRNVAPFRDHFRLQEACAELEVRHGLAMDNHTLDPAAQRRSGQTFLARGQKEAGAELLEARDAKLGWQEMHRVAAKHGLVVKLRGAGVVFGHATDRRLHAKGSDVDRGLSLKALADALGPYEPLQPSPLQQAYRQEREASRRAGMATSAALRNQQRAYAAELIAYYRARMKAERASARRGPLRRESIQHVAAKRREAYAELHARSLEERREVREAYKAPRWDSWVAGRAAEGNPEAVQLVSQRQARATAAPSTVRRQGPDMTPPRHLLPGRDKSRDVER